MKFIIWDKYPKTEIAAKIIAPTSKIKSGTFKEACDTFLKEAPTHTKQEVWNRKTKVKNALKLISGAKKLDSITVQDMILIPEKAKTAGFERSYANSIRSQVAAVIRWEKLHEVQILRLMDRKPVASATPAAPKTDQQTTLKISFAPLDTLKELLSVYETGRFSPLKIEVKRQIPLIPNDQYAVIKPTKLMLDNKKEREAARHAINGMLYKSNLDWLCVWSSIQHVFMVVRRKQYDETKKGLIK